MFFIGATCNTCWELIFYSKRKLFTRFSRRHIASNGVKNLRMKMFYNSNKIEKNMLENSYNRRNFHF